MRRLVIGILSFAALSLIWAGGWFFAVRQADAQLDSVLEAQHAQGRDLSCPKRSYGGFPFSLVISCVNPTFTASDGTRQVNVQVAGLSAEASLLHLRELRTKLLAPLTYRTSDGAADLRASWASLDVVVEGLPDVRTLRLDGRDVSVDGAFGATGRQGGTARLLDGVFIGVEGAATPSLDIALSIQGSTVPALDDFLGATAPVDINLTGRVDHVDAVAGITPEAALDAWRVAGGRLDLTQARLAHAESRVTASGALALDGSHRPEGRLDATFAGLDAVLARFGIHGNVAAATSLLGALLGGKPASAEAAPGSLSLPLQFRSGRLAVGPIRTDIAIPPLY